MKKKILVFMLKYLLFLCFVTGIGALAYFNGYGPHAADEEVHVIPESRHQSETLDTTYNIRDVSYLNETTQSEEKHINSPLQQTVEVVSNDELVNRIEVDPFDRITVDFEEFYLDEEMTLTSVMLNEADPIDGEIDFVGTSCEFDGAGIRLEGYVRNGTDAEFINQRIGLNVYTLNAAGEEFLLADSEFILLEDTFGILGAGEARHFSFRFGPNLVSNTAPDWSKGFRVEAVLID